MGFWNALSVLAPVAPAVSDARDLHTQREREAQDFAQEQELKKAQLLAQNLASQAEQQRIRAGTQPMLKPGSQPEFNPAAGTYQQPAWNPEKGTYELVNVPGESPEELNRQQLDSLKKNRAAAASLMPDTRPEDLDYLAYTLSGLKPPPHVALRPIPGAAGQPRLTADGKSYVRDMFDPSSNQTVEQPMPADYKPPEPKPGTPRPGLSQGRNVFGFFNPGKKQWQDAAGNALPDFQPQPSFAETGLYEPMGAYDQGTQSFRMGSFNRRTGQLQFSNSAGQDIPLPPAILATIGKDFATAREAQSRLRVMLANAPRAKAGDQQAALSLVANHIGMTLGAQKGARINQAVWNEAVNSAPWLQRVEAQWGPDGYLRGVVLTPGQVDQMVELAKQRNDVQWQQVKDTGETYGVDLSGAIRQTQGQKTTQTTPSPSSDGKQHSLRTAMALPFNKGKTAAQVKADLEAHGYKVIP